PVVIGLAADHPYRTGLAVDVDTSVGLVPFGVPVGGQQRGFDGLDHDIHRNPFVRFDRVQRGHVDVHQRRSSSPPRCAWSPARFMLQPPLPRPPLAVANSNSRGAGGENSTCTTAFAMSSSATSRTVQSRPRSSRTTSTIVSPRVSPARPTSCDPSVNV